VRRVKKLYSFVRDAESRAGERLKIGFLGTDALFKETKEAIGRDPLGCVVKLEDKKYGKDCDLVIDEAFLKEIIAQQGSFQKNLQSKIIQELADKKLALGRLMPGLREPVASQIIAANCKQNSLIAAAVFMPGADMPILTLNQMKMVVELAALYDKKLSVDRVKELLATLGSGYLFRSLARQMLGFLSWPGFILKSAVAFAGTKTMGKAVCEYYKKQPRSDS